MKKILENKILKNIGWLVVDKFLILFLQFFVGVKIANYYGSQVYGEYSYAMAIVGFSPIILEIINGRVVKEFYEGDFNKTVSSVTTFRNILSFLLFLGAAISYPFLKENMSLYLILVLLCFDNLLLTTTAGIESYFEYRLLSKNIVISNNIVKIASYSLQYIGLIMQLSILMIPIIRVSGSLLRMIILKRFYHNVFKEKVKFFLDKKLIKTLIKDSYHLWISFIAFIVYTQIDKIMIGKMLGVKEVGIYSIAIQLSGVLAILIAPFQNSIYPKMMELYRKDYNSYITFYLNVNTLFTQLYILLSILSVVTVVYLFSYVYSEEYSQAILCYGIMTISVFFKANGALQTGHMSLRKITNKLHLKIYPGLFLNIYLNYILIKKYGVYGAAWATTIVQICTIFIFDFFIKEYREQFLIQLKSLNIFYITNLIKKGVK